METKRYTDEVLLRAEHLNVGFTADKKLIPVIHDVNFEVRRGEILGIVGESGCGKSVTSLSILRLLGPGARIGSESRILLNGTDLLSLDKDEMATVRGRDISMIFQDPMTSLNPVKRIGKQIAEAAVVHDGISKKEAERLAMDMLVRVGIPAPEKRFYEYPHQLSGGMKQRVMIAMALICRPQLLIADEPTTALDVTTQAQILSLMRELNRELRTSVILITHDMGVVASMADNVAVMYAGRIAEYGSVADIFKAPKHPYTQLLLRSIPRLDEDIRELATISGNVPNPFSMPEGCKFHPRCPFAEACCRKEEPPMRAQGVGAVRCWKSGGVR